MRTSKLDRYLNILEVLVLRPSKLNYIAHEAKIEHTLLKRHMDFLVSNGLVEKRRLSGRQVVYAINERGVSVFKTLRALRYLEKLRASLPIIEEAQEITPTLSKHSKRWKEE